MSFIMNFKCSRSNRFKMLTPSPPRSGGAYYECFCITRKQTHLFHQPGSVLMSMMGINLLAIIHNLLIK